MATRLWGFDTLLRRGSNTAADMPDDQVLLGERRKSASRVQTLCSMRPKPGSGASMASSADDDDTTQDQQFLDQESKPMHLGPAGLGTNSSLTGSRTATPVQQQSASDLPAVSAATGTDGTDATDDHAPHDSASSGVESGQNFAGVPASKGAEQSSNFSNSDSISRDGLSSSSAAGSSLVHSESGAVGQRPNQQQAAGSSLQHGLPACAMGQQHTLQQQQLGIGPVQVPNGMPQPASAPNAAAVAGGGTNNVAALLAELQREAGLNDQQALMAAALLQKFATVTPGVSGAAEQQVQVSLASSAPTAGFLAPPHTQLGSNVPAFGLHVANGLGAGNVSTAGYQSSHNSSSSNTNSAGVNEGSKGQATGNMVPVPGDVTSPDIVYGSDGLDVPGTAQVAVHNVPFKWCNADLEVLFRDLPGYLDAQLLFHENGRSKGVGVALFTDRIAASEACARLSGAQADGRKLEMVLLSPDNHISFSCKQVAVLGLPWEYTAADVRALIEAAAEADGAPTVDAGVDTVEVAYREDGKSEGRAIVTFKSRRQAHSAITRLHGRETLAGLRMRLFYLHEQQQRARLMAQAPQSLITSVGQLSLNTPSPAVAATITANNHATHQPSPAEMGVRQFMSQHSNMSSFDGEGGRRSLEEAGSGVTGGAAAGAGTIPGSEESSSARSSFDKDQGPVILHVSGLMESVSREQLRELFSQAGEVTKVDIPDGGRSMGYGFITFSNPQAAEQAMLLFNNYPLGGGAIHVAYSTSATAKARQQALRQARKATLGAHASARASMDGGSSTVSASDGLGKGGLKPGTPKGPGVANLTPGSIGRRVGELDPAGLLGFGGLEGQQPPLMPGRHSFDHPGYISPALSRGRALSATGGAGSGLGNFGRGGGRLGFNPGLPGALGANQLQQLQLLQAAGAAGPAGLSNAGIGGPFDGLTVEQQLQLLMQMSGTDGSLAGVLGAQGFGATGTPSHAGGFGRAPGDLGLFNGCSGPTNMFAGAGGGGVSTGMPAGFWGGLPGSSFGIGANAQANGLMSPAGAAHAGPYSTGLLAGMGSGGSLSPFAASISASRPAAGPTAAAGPSPGPSAANHGVNGRASRQVVVTGLPIGPDESQVEQLFKICGPVQSISKPVDREVGLVTFETLEGAIKAVQLLDGTSMPSGGSLSVHFAHMPEELTARGNKGNNDGANGMANAFGTNLGGLFGGGIRPEGWGDGAGGFGGSDGAGMLGQGWNACGPPASPFAPGAGRPPAPMMANGGSAAGNMFSRQPGKAPAGLHIPSSMQAESPVGGAPGAFAPGQPSPSATPGGRLPPVYMASPVPGLHGNAPRGLDAFDAAGGAGLFGSAGPGAGSNTSSLRLGPLGSNSSAAAANGLGGLASNSSLGMGGPDGLLLQQLMRPGASDQQTFAPSSAPATSGVEAWSRALNDMMLQQQGAAADVAGVSTPTPMATAWGALPSPAHANWQQQQGVTVPAPDESPVSRLSANSDIAVANNNRFVDDGSGEESSE